MQVKDYYLFLWPTYFCYLKWYLYLNFSKLRLPLPYIEELNIQSGKKIKSNFIQCYGCKDFSDHSIVQKYMGDSPVAGKKQRKMRRMKQRERERKKKKRRKEGKQARRRNHLAWCSLAHSCTHMPLGHSQACSSAECKAPLIFILQCWRASKFCSSYVDLHRYSTLKMHSLTTVLPACLVFPLYIQ